MAGKIRVLIVDDSAFTRVVLKGLLADDPAIEVVGAAPDAQVAWAKIAQLMPDVLTLDVEMPGEDGLSFLERLMRSRPMPVVMVSSLTESGCAITLRALELGAVDFVFKPRMDIRDRLPEVAREVAEKIKTASLARIRRARGTHHGLKPLPGRVRPLSPVDAPPVVAVGASTGGTEAIREFLLDLPADFPGVVIVQHMPPRFTHAFAERLDKLCQVRVKEAADGDAVLLGHVLIAPGDHHMRLTRDGAGYRVRIDQEPHVNRHRPSVDVLFDSCAEVAAANAVGIILTGMGDDGARGLLRMRQSGARTLAQNEATCVVFGMPKSAIDLGAAEQVVALPRLYEEVVAVLRSQRLSPAASRPLPAAGASEGTTS